MTTTILRPTSDDSIQLSRSTGSYNYACVDEASEDTADYVYIIVAAKNDPPVTGIDKYGLTDPSLSGTINSVTVYARMYDPYVSGTSSESVTLGVRIGSTDYYGSDQTLPKDQSFHTYTSQWTTNPNTSSAWTWTNINDLVGLLKIYYNPGSEIPGQVRCSQYYIEVDYTSGWPNVTKINSTASSSFSKVIANTAVANIAKINSRVV
jgi:hypothetical protein